MDKRKFGNISFTTENMDDFIKKYNDQTELLPVYLDRIRNGFEFTTEMIENIEKFDTSSKMKIIIEYNRCMKIFHDNLSKES